MWSLLTTSKYKNIVNEIKAFNGRGKHCIMCLWCSLSLILSIVEKEDSDELTQEEKLQTIQCSTEPPNHQQENDYDGQKQPVNVKYMG